MPNETDPEEKIIYIDTLPDTVKNELIEKKVLISCRNKFTGKKVVQPADNVQKQLLAAPNTDWEFSISATDLSEKVPLFVFSRTAGSGTGSGKSDSALPAAEIKSPASETPVSMSVKAAPEPEKKSNDAVDNFGTRYLELKSAPQSERVGYLQNTAAAIAEFSKHDRPLGPENAGKVVDATKDSILINKISIEESTGLSDLEAKQHNRDLIIKTGEVVKNIEQIMKLSSGLKEVFSAIEDKAKANPTAYHMERVFHNSLGMLVYIQEMINQGVGAKLRIKYKKCFRSLYMKILPGINRETSTADDVIEGGIGVAVSQLNITECGLGFLNHDIGKYRDINYFSGEGAYNRQKIVQHVFDGGALIQEKTDYPLPVSLITYNHHFYYGLESGYGPQNDRIAQLRSENKYSNIRHALSGNINSVHLNQSMEYLPCAVIKICDVFDALTESGRKYRKAQSVKEVLTQMQKEVTETVIPKYDPILFDFFILFLRNKKKLAHSEIIPTICGE